MFNGFFIAIVVAFVIGMAVLIPKHISTHNEWKAKCTQAGGVPFSPRDAKVCLDPKAIIRP